MLKNRPLYIFVHVMKCAGNTVLEHVLNNFEKGEVLMLYRNRPPYPERTRESIEKHIRSLSQAERDKTRVIIGHLAYYGLHELFPGRRARYVTFLREPFGRTTSHYNFGRTMLDRKIDTPVHREFITEDNRILSLEKWFSINKVFNNYMFKFLFNRFFQPASMQNYAFRDIELTGENLERIKRVLDKFYFVGVVGRESDLLFLYNDFRVKKFVSNQNVSGRYLSEEDIGQAAGYMRPELEFDLKLYRFARQLNTKFKIKTVFFYFVAGSMRLKRRCYYLRPRVREGMRKIADKMRECHRKMREQHRKMREQHRKMREKMREYSRNMSHQLYRHTLGYLYELSAKLKKRSKLYTRFVYFIKGKKPDG